MEKKITKKRDYSHNLRIPNTKIPKASKNQILYCADSDWDRVIKLKLDYGINKNQRTEKMTIGQKIEKQMSEELLEPDNCNWYYLINAIKYFTSYIYKLSTLQVAILL